MFLGIGMALTNYWLYLKGSAEYQSSAEEMVIVESWWHFAANFLGPLMVFALNSKLRIYVIRELRSRCL